MPPSQPTRKFSLATAILAELEESEEIRSALRDARDASRAPSTISEVILRGPADDVDDEVLGLSAEDLVELADDEATAPPVSSRPSAPASVRPSAPASVRPSAPASVRPSAPASVRPSAPASVRPSAPASVRPSDSTRAPAPSAVDAAMLLGRAPIGSPRAPEVRETLDLESLMTTARSSRPQEADADWTYWPPSAIVHADPPRLGEDRNDEDDAVRAPHTAPARGERGAGRRVALALGAILAVGGAFAAGSLLNHVEPGTMRAAVVAGEPPAAAAAGPATVEAHAREDELAPSAAPSARAARLEHEPQAQRVAAARAAVDRAAAGAPAAIAAGVVVEEPVPGSEPEASIEEAEAAPTSAELAAADVPAITEPVAAPEEGEAAAVASLETPALEPGAAVAPEASVDPAAAEASASVALAAEPAPAEAPAEEPAPAAAIQAVVAPAAPAAIPELPSRADVRRALSGATPALRACTEHRGTAMVSITMSGSGGVIAANPAGAWASGADRSCVRQAIAGARLPRFRQSQLTVQFPFVL